MSQVTKMDNDDVIFNSEGYESINKYGYRGNYNKIERNIYRF